MHQTRRQVSTHMIAMLSSMKKNLLFFLDSLMPLQHLCGKGANLQFCIYSFSLLASILLTLHFHFRCVKLLTIRHPSIEADLYDLAAKTHNSLETVHPGGKLLSGVRINKFHTNWCRIKSLVLSNCYNAGFIDFIRWTYAQL